MLQIRSLGKRYPGGTVGLEDFSLDVDEGVLGLLGPNGAGKTTLMTILATVTRPDVGDVPVGGEGRGARSRSSVRRVLGYLPQDFGVYEKLTAREFLNYLGRLKGLSGADLSRRVQELLELTNLHGAADRRLGGFSGGMRQRVGIAQALLGDPKFVIVDEPTVGLDPEERVRFRNLLSEIAQGRVVILSTHIVSDVEAVASHIAVIRKGRLVTHATPEDLLRKAAGRVFSAVVSSAGARAGAEDGPRLQPRPSRRRRARALRRGRIDAARRPRDGADARGRLPVDQPRGRRTEARGVSARAGPIAAQIGAEVKMRLRSPATLAAVLIVFVGSVLWIPDPNGRASSLSWRMPDGRVEAPLYSTAYVGFAASALVCITVALVGFYLVAGSVRRDRESGVGAILAATPLSSADYLIGKFVAHCAYLFVVVGLALLAALTAWLRFGVGSFSPSDLLGVFVLLAIPAVAVTASLTVLFDVTPGLSGRGGYVAWFFAFSFVLIGLPMALAGTDAKGVMRREPLIDPVGAATQAALARQTVPGAVGFSTGLEIRDEPFPRVPWPGIAVTPKLRGRPRGEPSAGPAAARPRSLALRPLRSGAGRSERAEAGVSRAAVGAARCRDPRRRGGGDGV